MDSDYDCPYCLRPLAYDMESDIFDCIYCGFEFTEEELDNESLD